VRWQLATLLYDEQELELELPTPDGVELPALTAAERLWLDERMLGVSLDGHPLALLREPLNARGILGSRQLAEQPDGRSVQ